MKLEDDGEGLGTMSLESISLRLEDGRFTSELLVKVGTWHCVFWRDADMEEQTYIERIKQVDPFVKSIAQLSPDAVADAIERDRERQDGYIRGLVTSPGWEPILMIATVHCTACQSCSKTAL